MPAYDLDLAAQAVRARHAADLRRHHRSVARLRPFALRSSPCRLTTGTPAFSSRVTQQAPVQELPSPEHVTARPRCVVRPNAHFLADTRYPIVEPGDPAYKDICSVRVSCSQLCGGNHSAHSQPLQPGRKSQLVVIDGVRTLKRRAENTEIELVAGSHDVDTNSAVADTEDPRRMFGLGFVGRIAGMMSIAYSTVASFGGRVSRFVRDTSRQATESRAQLVPHNVDGPNVTNKRFKLSPPGDDHATWLPTEAALHDLLRDTEDFLSCLRLTWNIIATHASRSNMNRRLQPLLQALAVNTVDHDLIRHGEHDLCDAFYLHVENCGHVFSGIYNIGFYFSMVKKHAAVPATLDYGLNEDGFNRIAWARKFLSAPTLPTICLDILQTDSANALQRFPTKIADRVVLDLEAIQHSIPVPSFVKSEVLHEQLQILFQPPVRVDWERNLLLPGSYPVDDEEVTIPQEPEVVRPAPVPVNLPCASPRVQDPPPVIAKTSTGKTARLLADHCESRLAGITRQEFRSRFYLESDAHRAIRDTYISEFDAREPGTSATGLPKSILKNRSKHVSRRTPKRMAVTRVPRVVRFTDDTLTPQPRTHLGLDVPRLAEPDEDRVNVDVPFEATFDRIQQPWMPGRQNIFLSEVSDEARVEWAWLQEQKPKTKTTKIVRRGVHMFQMLNLAPLEGLTSKPMEEIVESLIKKELIDVSYRDTKRAKDAEEEAKRKAEEEVSLRAEEEARLRAEEEARLRAEEEARLRAEETRREEEETLLAKTGGLRAPRTRLISPVSADWLRKAEATLRASSTRAQARTGEGTDLRRHDFASVLPPEQWLNDEIINGSLIWLDRAINEASGIKDVRKQTRQCLTMNSFFFKDLLIKGPAGTERKLRRCGVTKNNLLDIETVLFPICNQSHWTILAIRPRMRTVMHIDSLNPGGSPRFTSLALAWLEDILQEKFVASEWQISQTEVPAQTNGFDCGVFTITNAMCLALGLSPIHSYNTDDMPLQRIRIACVLLNGGFTGDFDLGAY
ncbi:hypothetical protein CDD83_3486 [Cordyceps sp. RAO-2017]|nr:hypothetical protein CDD83_3486 [Cordyceps sp. RAO-2017]